MLSRTTLIAGLAALVASGSLAGCNLSKTGVVAPGAPDVVTVLPLVYGSATTVDFDPATASALTSLKISVAPSGGAVASSDGSSVHFPITSGYAEVHLQHAVTPGWIQGSISHTGSGLTLTGPPAQGSNMLTRVALSDFTVDPGNSVLYGTVNGRLPQIPLLTLDGTAVTEGTDSTGAVLLDGTVAKLTDVAAGALDTAFGITALHAGIPLGTVHVALTGQPDTYDATADRVTAFSRLTGTSTSVALDSATASALGGLGVRLAPLGTATFDSATATAGFPITGGMVSVHSNKSFYPGYVVGSVLHQGSGLSFTGPNGATVPTTDYVVDLGGSLLYATVAGKVGVPLLTLDGSRLTVSRSGSTVTLDGTVARLTATAAAFLDGALGITGLQGGTTLGTVHLVATGKPGS